ncbi:amidohydrolase [Desulfovibrio sp. OttesenSCG-928-C06]|nr:amidohydrolase [Desulfovibrio sp. OttesenSCG-928-C06]
MTKQNSKLSISSWIDANRCPFEEMALTLWAQPEIAHEEHIAARMQMDFMRERGFRVTQKDGLPTAFVAEWGSGGPVIGLLGEYDALAGLSQTVSAQKEPVCSGAPGHGCGHNLLGAGCMLAACALKQALEDCGHAATIRYYGCPAEEILTGKSDMAKLGYFDGLDVALTWHPSDSTYVSAATMTALFSAKFRFKGITSHAGSAPANGRSALDAVELMNIGANYLREHMLDQDRLHYVITNGGLAPNIVPGDAEVWYFGRAPHAEELVSLWQRLNKVAQGAAMMTETEVSHELLGGCYNTLPNQVLNRVFEENLLNFAGEAAFDDKDFAFARELQASLPPGQLDAALARSPLSGNDRVLASKALPCRDAGNFMMASSDVGDVANMLPTATTWAATWPVSVPAHSWQAVASAGSGIGLKGTIVAAKAMATTAFDLAASPELVEAAKQEFAKATNGRPYRPMSELLK